MECPDFGFQRPSSDAPKESFELGSDMLVSEVLDIQRGRTKFVLRELGLKFIISKRDFKDLYSILCKVTVSIFSVWTTPFQKGVFKD